MREHVGLLNPAMVRARATRETRQDVAVRICIAGSVYLCVGVACRSAAPSRGVI